MHRVKRCRGRVCLPTTLSLTASPLPIPFKAERLVRVTGWLTGEGFRLGGGLTYVVWWDGRRAVVGDTPWRLLPLVRKTRMGGCPVSHDRARLSDEVLGHQLTVQVLVQHLFLEAHTLLLLGACCGGST